MKMTPAQWIILDNIRCGYPIDTNLPVGMALDSIQWCKDRGFIEGDGMRLTHKGEIALRLSCIERQED